MRHKQRVRIIAPVRTGGVSFEVDGVELLDAQPSQSTPVGVKCVRRFRKWVGIRLEVPLDAGDAIELDLDVIGEGMAPLREEQFRWIPLPAEPRLLKFAEKTVDEVAGTLRLHSEDAAHAAAKAQAIAYFSKLDQRTNPALGILPVESALAKSINAVWGTLRERLGQRRRFAARPLRNERLSLHPEPEDVRAISRVMCDSLEEVFGECLTDPARLPAVGDAHDVFSWGGVMYRGPEPNIAPNGAAIFMFPEFAHLAIELAVEADRWTCLLPILTRMPALYLRVHELADPSFAPRPFEDYGVPPEFDYSDTELYVYAGYLASEYNGLGRRQLASVLDELTVAAFTL